MSNPSPNLDTSPQRVEPTYAMLPQCHDCKERVAFSGAHFDGLRWRHLRCWEKIPKPDADFDFGV